jgi:hypothetical protein
MASPRSLPINYFCVRRALVGEGGAAQSSCPSSPSCATGPGFEWLLLVRDSLGVYATTEEFILSRAAFSALEIRKKAEGEI